MPPTTAFPYICQSPPLNRNAKSGSLLLQKWRRLNPRAVIAGHKRVGNVDSPKILGETRRYIRDFERLAMQTATARELYDQMLKLYPDWGNPGALWTSVRAIKT